MSAPQQNEAIAKELASLKQALDHLATIERDLEKQRVELQAQITRYTEQAPLARQANRHDLADEAQTRADTLKTDLARVHEQLGRIVTRQKEITSRQFELLKKTSLGQMPATSGQIIAFRKPKKRRRVLLSLSVVVLLLALVGFGLAQVLHLPAPQPQSVTQAKAQASATAFPSATPTATPIRQTLSLPFKPDGTGPTNQQCERALGLACYSPEQIQQAFGLTPLYQQGFDGYGQTIVILGTGLSDSVQADLQHFDHTWGLPDPPHFTILKPFGDPAPYTCADKADDLQIENTLDVEWAHAIAPGANIILVIGSNSYPGASPDEECAISGLMGAFNYALNNQLGQIITMSYSGSELGYASETPTEHAHDASFYQQADITFEQAKLQNVTVLADVGDQGATNPDDLTKRASYWKTPNVGWPASDPYVLAVGGTTLQIKDSSGTYGSERVWNDGGNGSQGGGATGGGLSSIFSEPSYQQKLPNQAMLQGKRGIPDLSFPAEPSFALYTSFQKGEIGQANPSRWNHWDIIGGTSISTPCWAALIAIANQMRGKPLGFIQPALYSLAGQGMHDITSGNNSYAGVTGYKAQPGYDLATGWGTPIANQFLLDLIHAADQMPQTPLLQVTAPSPCG